MTIVGPAMPIDDAAGSLHDTADRLLRAGREAEAIAAYERLLALRPDRPDAWYNLGYLRHRAQCFDAALLAYQQALERGIGMPEEVHLNRAVILAEQLTRSDQAEDELRRALRLNPRYVPALLNLGNLHEQRGERESARDAYEAALAVEPGHATALARLANLQTPANAAGPLIARLRQALGRPGIAAVEAAELGFGLGKALDAAGAHDAAFAAYSAANRASRASAGPQGVHYDARAQERFVDRMIETFPAPLAHRAPDPAKGRSAPPVFICGLFRSGSSLVEQILASHSGVRPGGEVDLLPGLARQLLQTHRGGPLRTDDAEIVRLRGAYLRGIAARHPGQGVLTDKRPDNFLHIGLIQCMFPGARIVHTRRNAIDNCLAIFFLHLDHAMPYALDLADIAHWHGQYRRLMAHWKAAFGDLIEDVDYDALVSDPRPAIERLLRHCGLPWEDGCLAFHATKTVVKTPSAWQVRQPLYTSASGRWRHYETHLGPLRAALERC